MERDDKATSNILNHTLVPKHELLTQKEMDDLLKKYHAKPYQLPYIKLSDPAVITVGAKLGDIIKIIRESPTAGKTLTYRYVVEG